MQAGARLDKHLRSRTGRRSSSRGRFKGRSTREDEMRVLRRCEYGWSG